MKDCSDLAVVETRTQTSAVDYKCALCFVRNSSRAWGTTSSATANYCCCCRWLLNGDWSGDSSNRRSHDERYCTLMTGNDGWDRVMVVAAAECCCIGDVSSQGTPDDDMVNESLTANHANSSLLSQPSVIDGSR